MSRTDEALKLIDQGVKPFAAARQVGIDASQVYVALKRRRMAKAGMCPCCGQPLPRGQLELLPKG